MLVSIPDTLFVLYFSTLEWYHLLGPRFYVEIMGLIRSDGRVAGSNLPHPPLGTKRQSKTEGGEGRHLRELIGGQYRNSGSSDRRKLWDDGGLIVARIDKSKLLNSTIAKGSSGIFTKASLTATSTCTRSPPPPLHLQ